MMNRREFLAPAAVVTASPMLRAQSPVSSEWGGPILDIHSHLRQGLDANMVHMEGCGVTNAVLLTSGSAGEQVKAIQAKYPNRFVWSASQDITKPDPPEVFTKPLKTRRQGLGEIKLHGEADGPELRRMYALVAELDAPILAHFQEVPHFEGEGVFSTGFKRFEAMLKAYPKTRFIGHADAFWANLSADYANEAAYPTGPIN